MKIDSLTDIGVKRSDNQDNFWSSLLEVDGEEAGVICLCDGMGGLNDGGLASRMVIESVRDGILSGARFEDLEGYIKQVNTSIYRKGLREGGRMGTTCTLLRCYKGIYEIWHVGDSRCYLLNGNGDFEALTKDHSAVKEKNITEEENPALYKKYKNALTRCIGVKPEVVLDYYKGTYKEGDIFFVCSDGIWHSLESLNATKEMMTDLPNLVRNCISKGETDNLTACSLLV